MNQRSVSALAAATLLFLGFDWRMAAESDLARPPSISNSDLLGISQADDSVADSHILHEKFERTVFYSNVVQPEALPRQAIERWQVPIVIATTLTGSKLEFVEALANELSSLTGLAISVETHKNDASTNFYLSLLSRKEIVRLIEMISDDQTKSYLTNARCFGGTSDSHGKIVAAIVAIPDDLPDHLMKHCLVEEISQALGLYADSDVIPLSVFKADSPPITELPLNDKIIIRTLYDPRITPGMSRLEALEVAREVIKELLEGVEREGVEALYQRPADPLP